MATTDDVFKLLNDVNAVTLTRMENKTDAINAVTLKRLEDKLDLVTESHQRIHTRLGLIEENSESTLDFCGSHF